MDFGNADMIYNLGFFKILFGHGLYGRGVLGGRHTGDLLELSGEIVDGRVAESFGYLCEIHVLRADHLLGEPDLHMGKIFDNP